MVKQRPPTDRIFSRHWSIASCIQLIATKILRLHFGVQVQRAASAALVSLCLTLPVAGQQTEDTAPSANSELVDPSDQLVDVIPTAQDDQIASRIASILDATGWYDDASVSVDDGVVFLDGVTDSDAHHEWARNLSLRTSGVVAVVNRISVVTDVSWSLAPAFAEMRRLADRSIAALPLVLLAILILPLAWFAAVWMARFMRWLLSDRIQSSFLRDIVARAIAIPVFLVGLYVVLQVAGLTQLALSLVGGAGVLGIVIGFAFRDIAENFLASLLLSIRKPFQRGDLITVSDHKGFVQSMNTRSTVLVSQEGNHIQIPNAVVFKNIIVNLTAAPNQRGSLAVGIGYDASVGDAQDIILGVLKRHHAVCDDPEPMALIDNLGASTVNMMGYYWFDGRAISQLKLRSMLLRQVKSALESSGISMPDEAREVIFPEGVPVVGYDGSGKPSEIRPQKATQRGSGPGPVETEISDSEHDLSSEKDTLSDQMATPIEDDGTDLLKS